MKACPMTGRQWAKPKPRFPERGGCPNCQMLNPIHRAWRISAHRFIENAAVFWCGISLARPEMGPNCVQPKELRFHHAKGCEQYCNPFSRLLLQRFYALCKFEGRWLCNPFCIKAGFRKLGILSLIANLLSLPVPSQA
jgi:hypothetical protein